MPAPHAVNKLRVPRCFVLLLTGVASHAFPRAKGAFITQPSATSSDLSFHTRYAFSLSLSCVLCRSNLDLSPSLQTQTNVQHPSAVAVPDTRRQPFLGTLCYRLSHSFTASLPHLGVRPEHQSVLFWGSIDRERDSFSRGTPTALHPHTLHFNTASSEEHQLLSLP